MPTYSTEDRRRLLSKHFLFQDLSPKDIGLVAAIGSERRFSPGQVVFQKGDPGESMMAVLRGRVQVGAYSADGREMILAILNPGDVFGEMALLDGRARSADVSAMEESIVLAIERRDFRDLLERNPKLALHLLELLSKRIRDANEALSGVFFLELPGRLARVLLSLASSCGRKTARGIIIDMRLSQQDLGSLISATRESVNRQLRLWEEEDLVRMERGYITLLRPAQLAEHCAPAET